MHWCPPEREVRSLPDRLFSPAVLACATESNQSAKSAQEGKAALCLKITSVALRRPCHLGRVKEFLGLIIVTCVVWTKRSSTESHFTG